MVCQDKDNFFSLVHCRYAVFYAQRSSADLRTEDAGQQVQCPPLFVGNRAMSGRLAELDVLDRLGAHLAVGRRSSLDGVVVVVLK